MSDALGRLGAALADRYRIERELGQGGMATVYLAQDLKHDRKVALKVLRPELSVALGHERFLREITTTANLRHPHILPLYDSGRTDGPTDGRTVALLYYVMPYIEGESLRDRLTREGQLPINDAVQLAREVAEALGYAHARGVIHRDIKPENILLEQGHAVVADFGIARAVSVVGADKLTQTGMAIGTPIYMSPEQSEGEGRLDGRSDLYALGCVLYEMLAGEPPYSGPTAHAIIAKRLMQPVPRVSTLRETVSPALEATLSRALAKAPADRFATAEEFVAALTASSSGASASAATPSAVWADSGGLRAEEGFWVAVLPFKYGGANADLTALTEGLSEEIITGLSRFSYLRVVGRGQTQGARYVLEGSLRHVGSRLRVAVQLLDAATGAHLWAENYERAFSPETAFDLQDELVPRIVSTIADMHGILPRSMAESLRGDRERGLSLAERAKQLNPHHPGWYWAADFFDAYRRRDYAAALEFALKDNMPGHWAMHAIRAAAYGQLGQREAAAAAAQDLLNVMPNFVAIARQDMKRWWEPAFVEHLADGWRKAGLDIPAEHPRDEPAATT